MLLSQKIVFDNMHELPWETPRPTFRTNTRSMVFSKVQHNSHDTMLNRKNQLLQGLVIVKNKRV